MRTIYVPGVEKHVPLGIYVAGIKKAKANPDMEFKHGLAGWWPTTGREIVRDFLRGVHDRINQGIPYNQRGKPS